MNEKEAGPALERVGERDLIRRLARLVFDLSWELGWEGKALMTSKEEEELFVEVSPFFTAEELLSIADDHFFGWMEPERARALVASLKRK